MPENNPVQLVSKKTVVQAAKALAIAFFIAQLALYFRRKLFSRKVKKITKKITEEVVEQAKEEFKDKTVNEIIETINESKNDSESEVSDSENQESLNAALSFILSAKTPSEMEEIEVFDGKTAAAYVAYAFSELAFVYPVGDSDYLGQIVGDWATHGGKNAQGNTVKFSKMETKPGAGAALHGALAGGAVASAFTSSEAIPMMIPSLSKIAHSRLPTVIHTQSRGLDSETLCTKIDQSSLLSASQTGSVLISSSSVQEIHDLGVAAHISSFLVNLPVVHFFDGVRTSSESTQTNVAPYSLLNLLVDQSLLEVHHQRSSISKDLIKITPLEQVADQIANVFEKLSNFFGRKYKLFDYVGDKNAQTVIIMLSAGSQSTEESVLRTVSQGERVGLIKVRLYRPWSPKHLIQALPSTVKTLVVIDQVAETIESTPLYQDVVASLSSAPSFKGVRIISSTLSDGTQEILPSMIDSVLKLSKSSNIQKQSLVIGSISDDSFDSISSNHKNTMQCSIWEVDQSHSKTAYQSVLNTIGKNSIGINVQGFASKSSFGISGTISNYQIRFGEKANKSSFSVRNVDFVACHDESILSQFDVLERSSQKSIFLLNSKWTTSEELEANLPSTLKKELATKEIHFYPVDASVLAPKLGLDPSDPVSITAVLQTLFYKLAKLDQALVWHQQFLESQQTSKKDLKSQSKSTPLTAELLQNSIKLALQPFKIPSEWKDIVLEEKEEMISNSLGSICGNDNSRVESSEKSLSLKKWHQAAWSIMFPEALETTHNLKTDSHGTFLVTLTENRRLTPNEYDRNVFHLEFDTEGTGLKYEIGDALGVYGHNDEKQVEEFIKYYGLNAREIVTFKNKETNKIEQRTVEQVFGQVLDMFGRPPKRFYQSLIEHAKDPEQKTKLEHLVSSEGSQEFKQRVSATVTYVDLLKEFNSARPSLAKLIEMVDQIKPRHYSIASSMKMHPNSVHLLVVLVDWVTPTGEKRFGQCTRYLSTLPVGSKVTVSVKPSVMKLPPLDSQPVIMAGLGTGMAPFRAFIEERAFMKKQGKDVGPMVLYFGSRHRSMEYLYGEELEAYHEEGVLTHLRLAFSRDQKEKIYIQHKIAEDDQIVHDYLLKQDGHFYLCGPTWPAGDVRDAIASSFSKIGGMSQKQAIKTINDLKDQEKYILEVY